MGEDNKGGTAGVDLERARSLFTAVAESSYRAEKASDDDAWEEMRINFLQMRHGKCLFAPQGFYMECGYDMLQAGMLFADGQCGVNAGPGRLAIISINSE